MKLSAKLTVMKTHLVFLLPGSWFVVFAALTKASCLSKECICLAILPLLVTLVVERTPMGIVCMCPISVASSTEMKLLIVS